MLNSIWGLEQAWRKMQVLNLKKEFESPKMRDDEAVEKFANRLLKIVNQIRILWEKLLDKRIIERILVSFSENLESNNSLLEETKDLNQICLTELVNALWAT